MKKTVLSCIIVFFMLFWIIGSVGALGVTPGLRTIDFEPGIKKKFDLSVVNSEKKNMNVVIFVQGELNQSVYLSENSFFMNADEEYKSMSYEINVPDKLSPGTHSADIVIMQLPEKQPGSDTFVGATVAVVSRVNIVVPYPGKYIEAELNVNNANQGEEVLMVIPVTSMGNLGIESVRANIDIYNSMYEKIGTLNTDEISLESKERAEMIAKWKAGVPLGTYKAVATIIYDGETIMTEKQFNVGQNDLELQEVMVRDFKLGDIAKFEMLVENKWSDEIKNVYAQTQVFDNEGRVMTDFKSATYDISALSKKAIVSYWDTGGVKEGTYDASVFLRYGEKSSQKNMKLKVSEDSLEAIGLGYVISEKKSSSKSNTNFLLIIVIAVLVLINFVWFLIVRKKLKKK